MSLSSSRRYAWFAALLLIACGSTAGPDADAGAGPNDAGPPSSSAVHFDLRGSVDTQSTFFDFPFPSDLRTDGAGRPVLTGYPNPRVAAVDSLLPLGEQRPGWPTIPVGYFRFGAPVASRTADDVIPAESGSPVLLVDVDPDSPDRGELFETLAISFAEDRYTALNLLGVASFPGIVLHPGRTYAFVVQRSFGDGDGAPLDVNPTLAQLMADEVPDGAWGADAAALYAPLLETLDTIGVARTDVAAATVFTTGDVVQETYEMSEGVLEAYSVTIDGLGLDPIDGARHDRYCALVTEVSQPQFQVGTPPFNTDGHFEYDAAGRLVEQRQEATRLVITIPKTEMPTAGYPLMVYWHGSGGIASQVIDRGPRSADGFQAMGEGPGYMIAEHGFASVGAALPLSPDRLPGATSTEYLNFDNLAAFPFTFRQGVFEQRLLMRALMSLEIDPSVLEGCDGPALPAGETTFQFDPASFVGLGQSMGGMYTNMIGAVEPGLRALVPTGAGGFWSFFILETSLIEGVRGLIGALLRADGERLTHLHPAMHLLEMAWEPAEPMVYMPRLSRRPLDGFTSRPVYQPVGQGDSFFPIQLYDAVTLAYGHPQAGDVVWPSMQDSLAVGGLDGIIDYPVAGNLMSEAGSPYTGVVVQHAGDGFSDPHSIYVQVPEIQYQWGCFLRTAIDGNPTVLPPALPGSPCL